MLITATFIGQDGSLGYRNGRRYTLRLDKRGRSISRMDGTGYCPYASIRAFLRNWREVTMVPARSEQPSSSGPRLNWCITDECSSGPYFHGGTHLDSGPGSLRGQARDHTRDAVRHFLWRPNSEGDPNFQGASSFRGTPNGKTPKWLYLMDPLIQMRHAGFLLPGTVSAHDHLARLNAQAQWKELLILRSILLWLLGHEVEDDELRTYVERREHPNGAVEYHTKSANNGLRDLGGRLLLRKLEPGSGSMRDTAAGRFVYAEFESPYFEKSEA